MTQTPTNNNDHLIYEDNNDNISGLDGNDKITAGYGNDLVYGGNGDDFISGDADGAGIDPVILVSYDFEDNAEGWTFGQSRNGPFIGDGVDPSFYYQSSGGTSPDEPNPDGVIRGRDASASASSTNKAYYQAGSELNGNLSAAVDGNLSFNMYLAGGTYTNASDMVIISGTNASGVSTSIFLRPPSATNGITDPVGSGTTSGWKTINIPMVKESFRNYNGSALTDADFKAILSSITSFKISADYSDTGFDHTALDHVVLTAGPDRSSLTADDRIYGGDGSDTIFGGDGSDAIFGGLDNDTIYGDAGNDGIQGNEGDDTVYSGDGNDHMLLGTGNDIGYGGDGNDTIYGEAGNDQLYGDAGTDNIRGGDGDDQIYGGADGDSILGEAGSDEIYGGDGIDSIGGGTGNDFIYGGLGNDTLDGSSDNDIVEGGEGNDTIYGGTGDDSIRGDAGVDLIYAGDGQDIIEGGADDDRIYADDGDDTVFGGDGVDAIFGGLGSDALYGDAGDDRFEGNEGDDIVFGGTGNDSIKLGTGDLDIAYGGDGNDFIQGDAGVDELYGDAGSDSIRGGDGDDIIFGGADNDTILADSGNDAIFGDEGDDNIGGGLGDDIIDGGDGSDFVDGGAGNDILTVGLGDYASGGDDRDSFFLTKDQLSTNGSTTFEIDGGTGSTAAGDVDDYDIIEFGPGLSMVDGTLLWSIDETGVPILDNNGFPASSTSYSGSFQVTDGTNTYTVNFSEIEAIVCFVRGSLIDTSSGPKPIETLKVGDLVLTKDNGYKPISWIGSRSFSKDVLTESSKLYPVRIRQGALGDGLPEKDLYVSPQHRMLVKSKIVERVLGVREALVTAKQLTVLDGIDIVTDFDEVEYFHILFDQHEIVFAEGAETESLYVGKESLKSLGDEACEEIFTIFPELRTLEEAPKPARALASGYKVKQMAQRHAKNEVTVFSSN